jgi:hypothetical protein
MADGLRLIVYDATQKRRRPAALGLSWQYGAHLYRGLGRVDASYGAHSFADALRWLGQYGSSQPIAELQFWGHGKWGRIFIDREALDRSVLQAGHPQHVAFAGLRERLLPNALLWFRTCETLGAQPGHDFASALADATGARIAGHTYVIGFLQSGLHCLRPGARPHWPVGEGLLRGTPQQPELALGSSLRAPNTITCLDGLIPEGF